MNALQIQLNVNKVLDGPGHDDPKPLGDTDYCRRHNKVCEWITGTMRGMNALEDVFTNMSDQDTGELLLNRLESKMKDDIAMGELYGR